MKEELVKTTCIGTTPLIMQRISKDMLVRDNKKRKPEAPPVEEFLYKSQDGKLYTFPNRNILSCIRDGAARVIERNRTSYKNTILGFISMPQVWIPLVNLDGKPFDASKDEGWVKWERPLTRGNGEKIWAVSPMFEEWRIDFDLLVSTDLISTELVMEILEASGKISGFGSAITIGFGRFTVKVT